MVSACVYAAGIVVVTFAMVRRAAIEKKLSSSSSRPWLRFQQLVALSMILRCIWFVMSAKHLLTSGTSAHCLTGFDCAGPIFVTTLNRMSMLLFFGAFALAAEQLLRIGRVGLGMAGEEQSDTPATKASPQQADGKEGGINKKANARRDKLIFRCDLMYLILSVWLLIVQIIIIVVSLVLTLPEEQANNIYDAYIIQVAVLSLLIAVTFGMATRWIWKYLTSLITYHQSQYLRLTGVVTDASEDSPRNLVDALNNPLKTVAAVGTKIGSAAVAGARTVAQLGNFRFSRRQMSTKLNGDVITLQSGRDLRFTTAAEYHGAKLSRCALLSAPVPTDMEAYSEYIQQQIVAGQPHATRRPLSSPMAMETETSVGTWPVRVSLERSFTRHLPDEQKPLLQNDMTPIDEEKLTSPKTPTAPARPPVPSLPSKTLSFRGSAPVQSNALEAAKATYHRRTANLMWHTRWRLVSIVVLSSSLLIFRSVMFLWRPISNTSFIGMASEVLYPWFFYTIPEVVPAVLVAWLVAGAWLDCRIARGGCCRLRCRKVVEPAVLTRDNAPLAAAGMLLAFDDGSEASKQTRAFLQACHGLVDADRDGITSSALESYTVALEAGMARLEGRTQMEQERQVLLHAGKLDIPASQFGVV